MGGLNEVKVFHTDNFEQVTTISAGNVPHGIWPSGDPTGVYGGLENSDALTAFDTASNEVIAMIPIGQAPQRLAYVSNAVLADDWMQNSLPLGVAGKAAHRMLASIGTDDRGLPTSIALFDQGPRQIMQASATGLAPKHSYVLALSSQSDGSGTLEPLAAFTTNSAGAAAVSGVGAIHQMGKRPTQ